ncbi:MAG: EF-P lysine aminoacylase GenX [Luminiphilus sp.]|nr:EF-P lysine aminoacylase GenX [Luminiphilus sp.]
MSDWRPSATLEAIEVRASTLGKIRQFFAEHEVTEVEVPLLGSSGVTDPAIDLFEVPADTGTRFLQSSPEYAMKRLLAAGSGDIFYCGKAFRASEVGSRHNPEFTLLEWYRLDWDHHQLIAEVASLIEYLVGPISWQIWSYQQLFEHCLGLDPHRCSDEELQKSLQSAGIKVVGNIDRRASLDLLLTHIIEPKISHWGLVFITDFPSDQAALARVLTGKKGPLAARFEAYYKGVELANGYWEETNVTELERRFEVDRLKRVEQGAAPIEDDPRFLAAHRSGLPDCAGVALGVDRLLMAITGQASIGNTLSFDWLTS